MRPHDTSPEALAVQLDVYRRMSPAARLGCALELTRISRALLVEGIRRRHPEYGEVELRLAFLRAWLGADLFRLAYEGEPELAA